MTEKAKSRMRPPVYTQEPFVYQGSHFFSEFRKYLQIISSAQDAPHLFFELESPEFAVAQSAKNFVIIILFIFFVRIKQRNYLGC